jgi:hypothetical protein
MIDRGNRLIELLSQASQALPSDSGRRRPMDEDRFIFYLADQFESSGGRALAYANKHKESGVRRYVVPQIRSSVLCVASYRTPNPHWAR